MIKIDHHKHIINTLGARYGLAQIALGIGDKDEADKIFKEAEEWFKSTYKVERINSKPTHNTAKNQ